MCLSARLHDGMRKPPGKIPHFVKSSAGRSCWSTTSLHPMDRHRHSISALSHIPASTIAPVCKTAHSRSWSQRSQSVATAMIAKPTQLRDSNDATKKGTRITSVGRFPARFGGTQLAIRGSRRPSDVTSYLEGAGWTEDSLLVGDVMAKLDTEHAFKNMTRHFHAGADGLRPNLGLGFLHVIRLGCRVSPPERHLSTICASMPLGHG